MSDRDLASGVHWPTEIKSKLNESIAGIVCVTPENRRSPWLHYEAGALAHHLEQARVIPYLSGLSKADLEPPLGHFQAVDDDYEGTISLVNTLNAASAEPLATDVLTRAFDFAWKDVERQLDEIAKSESEPEVPPRTDREVLEEILALVRGIDAREPSASTSRESLIDQMLQREALKAVIADRTQAGAKLGLPDKPR
jgi:hypothetical protein